MKKRHLFLGLLLGTCLIGGASVGIARNIQINNEIQYVNKNIAKLESNDDESEETKTKVEQLKEKINELMNSQLVTSIVSYSTTITGVVGFVVTFFKYKKYKSINNEQIAEIVSKVTSEDITAKYEELETKVVNELIEKFGNVEEMLNVLEKVIILAQDTSAKGRAALLEYLSTKVSNNESTSEEVKETVEQVKESATEEVEKQEEVIEKVQDDYTPIE